jgi:hypothetical protein
MKFAVSEMSFEPPLATPVTYKYFMHITQSLDDCLAVREIHWQYSLVLVKGGRSVCVYYVPLLKRHGRLTVPLECRFSVSGMDKLHWLFPKSPHMIWLLWSKQVMIFPVIFLPYLPRIPRQ